MPLKRKSSSWHVGYWSLLAVLAMGGILLIFQWLKVIAPRIAADFYYPYTAGPAAVKELVTDQSLLLRSTASLAAEVQTLRRQNTVLAAQTGRLKELENENRELRAMCRMSEPEYYRYKPCEVITRDPISWEEHFTINAGSAAGVRPGAAVLALVPVGDTAKTALVGVVRQTSRHTSQVLSIQNTELRLSVMLPGANAVGFLNAAGTGHPSPELVALDFLPVGRNYTLGEEAVTTGMETLVPEGIAIGQLGKLEPLNSLFSDKLYRSGGIRPLADLNVLRQLLVVVPEHGD